MDQNANGGRLLEMVGTLLAIAGVLLPVTGLAARIAAFSTLPFDSNSRWFFVVAWSAPLTELALWGFLASLIALGGLALFYFVIGLFAHPRVRSQPPPTRRATRTVRGIGIVLLMAWLLFTPSFPAFWIFILACFLASLITRRSVVEVRHLRLAESWWVFAVFLIVAGAVLGLTGTVPGSAVATYRFKAEIQPVVTDGQYDRLGEADSFAVLSRCGTSGRTVLIADNEILSISPASGSNQGFGPSLFDVFVHGRRIAIGYQPC